MRAGFACILCFVLLGVEVSASSSQDPFQKCAQKRFAKYKQALENTTWIVPPSTLLAYEYTAGADTALQDQTVWMIDRFDNGYFFGSAYVGINGSPSSSKHMVGSVTPFGDVYISFYAASEDEINTDVVVGVGTCTRIDGKYVFIMQTSSGDDSLTGLSHWSYMISIEPDDYWYQNLPSVNMSVPQFISLFSN